MARVQKCAEVVRIEKNPRENKHHDIRTDTLRNQSVFVFGCDSLQDRVFRKVIGAEKEDNSNVNSVVRIRIGDIVFQISPQVLSFRPGRSHKADHA